MMAIGLVLVTLANMAFGVKEKRADVYPVGPEGPASAGGNSPAAGYRPTLGTYT
jgi:hypothetical protein